MTQNFPTVGAIKHCWTGRGAQSSTEMPCSFLRAQRPRNTRCNVTAAVISKHERRERTVWCSRAVPRLQLQGLQLRSTNTAALSLASPIVLYSNTRAECCVAKIGPSHRGGSHSAGNGGGDCIGHGSGKSVPNIRSKWNCSTGTAAFEAPWNITCEHRPMSHTRARDLKTHSH